ncbi:MAG: nitrilase-related carbon-nitrogen hydrolase [Candidatus Geothermarchaeales archaeon]
MREKVGIGYVQPSIAFGKKERNVERALELAAQISESDLIVFPELFNTGYTFRGRKEAEGLAEDREDGYTSRELSKFSEDSGTCVVAGFVERWGDQVYNSAIVIHEGEVLGSYRKIHLFFKEKEWFDPGDLGLRVFDTGSFRLGVMICFDWIFPEAARTLALRGSDIIAHPSNLVRPYAQHAMLTRSVENRVYTVTANRIGREQRGGLEFEFTGQSQVTTPDMEVIHRAPEAEEEVFSTEIHLEKARNKNYSELNHLFQGRRTEAYRLG